jgi:multicomponent Na+:H+ antiporter subunit A
VPTFEPDTSLLLPTAVALPFAAFLLVGTLGRHLGRARGWVVLLAAAGAVAAVASVAAAGGAGVASFHLPWMPTIGVELALRAEPFGMFLALVVAGVGVAIALYSIAYMAGEDEARLSRFYSALAAFMGSMLGIALADDLILLFVFWELTSISSFVLIGFRFDDDRAKAGALVALQVTALGGLVMSVGFLLLGQIAGTFSISTLAGDPGLVARVNASPLGGPALLLILAGAFTKSAQFPFHFWLPRAMVAPTPVSAYLHAATMVKAGIYLLGRMLPIFGPSPLWAPILVSVGTVTMLLGAYQAFRETDLKAILARTTGSTLGLLTLVYGLGSAEQDALQILNHTLYKGALFLVAGIVEHRVHTRDIRQLGGLRRDLPFAFAAGGLACVSMAGAPPLFGFLAKESFYAAILHAPGFVSHPLAQAVVVLASVATSALLAAVAAKLVVGTFLGEPSAVVRSHTGATSVHHESPPLWIAPMGLALAALGLGALGLTHFPEEIMATASSRPGGHLHLSLIPELGAGLYLSITAFAIAALLFFWRDRVAELQETLSRAPAADAIWQRLLDRVAAAGQAFASHWQNGSLRWYLTATIVSVPAAILVAFHILGLSYRRIEVSLLEMPWYGLLLCVLLGIATLITVQATTRLQAAIATTTVGFLVSMIFVVYRSPDILLTQILIETVSTIFVLLVLAFLPAFPKRDLTRTSQISNFVVAGVFSLTIVVLLLLAVTPGLRETAGMATRPGGLLSIALAEGGGMNAVNVIIVDIRAMDTTGEVTVLVVVGLTVYGLLRSRRAVS